MIQKNVCKADIFSVISGYFDTRLKILTPAPLVVLVTNIRYEPDLIVSYNSENGFVSIVTLFEILED